MHAAAAFGIGIACIACVACVAIVPDSKTPVDRARDVEAKCRGLSDEGAAALLAPSFVDSVEPAYSYVYGGPNGREARLRGARLHVRPLAGMTRESIARDLVCHEMRVVLSVTPVLAGDPYVLQGKWLAIDVESEGDGFVVLARTDDFDDAQRVLARAKAFAATRDRN